MERVQGARLDKYLAHAASDTRRRLELFAEIAEILELRESVVKSRLFEAVQRLRRADGGGC